MGHDNVEPLLPSSDPEICTSLKFEIFRLDRSTFKQTLTMLFGDDPTGNVAVSISYNHLPTIFIFIDVGTTPESLQPFVELHERIEQQAVYEGKSPIDAERYAIEKEYEAASTAGLLSEIHEFALSLVDQQVRANIERPREEVDSETRLQLRNTVFESLRKK